MNAPSDAGSTLEELIHGDEAGPGDGPRPGLLVLFSGGEPRCSVLECGAAGDLELGRGTPALKDDRRISRRHARVRFADGRCLVHDLGSQNGTFIDGKRSAGGRAIGATNLLRIGDSLLLPCPDVRPYQAPGMQVHDGRVTGPQTAAAHAAIAAHAPTSPTLHIRGESGTGKEEAARTFHAHGPYPRGPFVAVNCATIAEGIAERLLFGAVRGAYSGADQAAVGYLEAAHGGTLFLDEIAELGPGVQAKLLRVLESREVMPLGAVRARPLDLRLCSATHRDLRALVGTGPFRADLFFRIGTPLVPLVPLRERPADIPFLIAQQVAELRVHASFVEACLLRPWPGNVRELLAAVRTAVLAARAAGSERLDATHLEATAGTALLAADLPSRKPPASPRRPAAPRAEADQVRTAAIREALRASGGNVTAAATALGIHRTQLRRWIQRCGIDPRSVP